MLSILVDNKRLWAVPQPANIELALGSACQVCSLKPLVLDQNKPCAPYLETVDAVCNRSRPGAIVFVHADTSFEATRTLNAKLVAQRLKS